VLRALGWHIWRRLRVSCANLSEPAGGFYLFPNLAPLRERLAQRGIADSRALSERLLEETGVATLPGVVFGRPMEELTLRLAYVDFDGARALLAAEQLAPGEEIDPEFLSLYCPNVVQAIEAACRWLK
jgi:aspartate aminotransferase